MKNISSQLVCSEVSPSPDTLISFALPLFSRSHTRLPALCRAECNTHRMRLSVHQAQKPTIKNYVTH